MSRPPGQGAGDSQGVARAHSGSPDTVPCMPSTDAAEMTAMQTRITRLGHLLDDVDIDGFGGELSDSEIFFHTGGRHDSMRSFRGRPRDSKGR